jgi:hypothetical protein
MKMKCPGKKKMEGLCPLLDMQAFEEQPCYLVSIEQRDESGQRVQQYVASFTNQLAMERALCTELCDQLCEFFYEDFHACEPLAEDDPRTRLMYFDWRRQELFVRPQYRYDLMALIAFATAYMRTQDNRHAMLSVVAQRSVGSNCTRILSVY